MYIVECVTKGEAIATDWCGGLKEGSVVLTGINEKVAAEGTYDAIVAAIAKLKSGDIKVFDTANFTVANKKLDSYLADVDTDAAFEKDTEAIHDGYFDESSERSAPYFDIQIDGITLLNVNFG